MSALNIVVTGDDFGQSIDTNIQIEYCHRNGILSSTSLVANGAAFDDAVKIVMRNPTLGVGVHLALDTFMPLYREMSSIIDPQTRLFYSHTSAKNKIKTFQCRDSDLVREYSLQVEKVLDSGISITHLDHHHHLHLYWPPLRAMIIVAKKYNIRYIRSQKLILPSRQKIFFNKLYRHIHQLYLRSRAATADGYFDIDNEFEKTYNRIIQLINSNYRIVEVVSHPSLKNNHEVTLLTNRNVINLIRSCKLVHFGAI